MYFPKSFTLLALLLAAVVAVTLLLIVYFQGGLETAFPSPVQAQSLPLHSSSKTLAHT